MAQGFSPVSVDPSIYNYGDFFNNVAQGYQLAQMPQQMRNQQQSDALNLALLKNKAQYEPQMSQAELQAKLLSNKNAELTNQYLPQEEAAKMALLQAQSAKAGRPDQPKGEYYGLLQYYNGLPPGPEKDMVKQRLDVLGSGSNGTTVYGENGQPLVQIGGKPGSVSLDANGNAIATPTNAEATRLERGIVGIDTALPYVSRIADNLGQFQNGWTDLSEKGSGIANRWLNTNFELPSQKAQGQADLRSGAEGIMSAFQLNSTNKNLQTMIDILSPKPGEAVEGYKNRAAQQVVDFVNQQNTLKNAHKGIDVTTNAAPKNNSNSSSETVQVIDSKGQPHTIPKSLATEENMKAGGYMYAK